MPAVSARTVEEKIKEALSEFLQKPDIAQILFEENRLDDEAQADEKRNAIKEKQNDLAKIKRYIANLSTAIRENGYSKSLLNDLNRYELEEWDIQAEIEKAQSYELIPALTQEEISGVCDSLNRLILSNDLAEVSAALRYLLINVELDREKTMVSVRVNFRILGDDLKINFRTYEDLENSTPLLSLLAKCSPVGNSRGGTT